jgi:hypothetical protein
LSNPTPPQIAEAQKVWKAEKEKGNNSSIASEEAARRYYSVKEFYKSGVANVFKPIFPLKRINDFMTLKINGLFTYKICNDPARNRTEFSANPK